MPSLSITFDRTPPADPIDHEVAVLDGSMAPERHEALGLTHLQNFIGGQSAMLIEAYEDILAKSDLDPDTRNDLERRLAASRADFADGDGPWFAIEDGLEWLVHARNYVEAHPERFEDWPGELAEVRRELNEMETVLRIGLPHGARWQFIVIG